MEPLPLMTDDPGMGQLDIWHAGSIIDCLNLFLEDVVYTQPWPGPIVNETWFQADHNRVYDVGGFDDFADCLHRVTL